jgi:adenosylhomocysteine nucleosidase
MTPASTLCDKVLGDGEPMEELMLIAAEPREFAGLLPLCPSVETLASPLAWARRAVLNGRRMVLAANGAGPANAAEAFDWARGSVRLNAVVSIGFCGALDPALKIGDVFAASRIQTAGETAPVALPRSERHFASGTLVSIDRVAQTAEEKRNLCRSGAAAVEMEAAGVYSRVREWGLPFFCIRAVTDLADETFRNDFNAARRADGRFSTARILAGAARRPFTALPELMELRRRCRIASGTLGEFLADCSF